MANTNNSISFLNTQLTEAATDIKKLIQQYPYLLIIDREKEYISSLITAAKNIRTELKKAFPGSKFSVTTQRYAGGDNINVYWTDGAAYTKVEDIIGKYRYGTFNGMEDIYEYNKNLFNDAFGAAMYVFANREVTPLLYSKIAKLLGFTTTGIYTSSGDLEGLDSEQTEEVQRKARKIDFKWQSKKNGRYKIKTAIKTKSATAVTVTGF